jgi:hypothetical protein
MANHKILVLAALLKNDAFLLSDFQSSENINDFRILWEAD